MNTHRRALRFIPASPLLIVGILLALGLAATLITGHFRWLADANGLADITVQLRNACENALAVLSNLGRGRVTGLFAIQVLGAVLAGSVGLSLFLRVSHRVRPGKAGFLKNIWRVIQFIPEYRGRIFGVLAAGTVLGAIGAGTPYLYKKIVDVITKLAYGRLPYADAADSILQLLAIFFALRFALVVFGALQDKQADDLWLETVSSH